MVWYGMAWLELVLIDNMVWYDMVDLELVILTNWFTALGQKCEPPSTEKS